MRKPSPSEPITELRHVKIFENGEPLVDFLKECPELVFDRPKFTYRRETLVRESVARMLCQAAKDLPKGYRLAILEGWRPIHIQRRMYSGIWKRLQEQHPDWSDTKLKRVANRFTAPIGGKVPPPHSTGAAVDVFLVKPDGSPHDHTSPFWRYDHHGFATHAKGLSEEAQKTRQILWDALMPTGLTNYPSEYWHWSYGDQGWAYRGGHPHALYGPVEPQEYEPDPNDVSDEPLVLLEQ